MYFIGGGGVWGVGVPLLADDTPAQRKPPPQNPPFCKFGSRGVFKQDIRFPRTPPPLRRGTRHDGGGFSPRPPVSY